MIIKQPKTQIDLGPQSIDVNNVQYYSNHTKELAKSQVHKALCFAKLDLIKYAGGVFVCEPIPGYNSTVYTIDKSKVYEDTFTCNCQGWMKKYKEGEIIPGGANCSHVLALYFCFRMKKQFQGFEDNYNEIVK